MKKEKRKSVRLTFSENELKNPELQKPIEQVQKAQHHADKVRKRLHQTAAGTAENPSPLHHAETADAKPAADQTVTVKRIQRQQSTEFVKRLNTEPTAKGSVLKSAVPDSIQSRLHSVSELEAPKPRLKSGAAGKALRNELHKQIEQDEADNTGLQAAHTLERSGETAVHTGSQIRDVQTTRRLKQAVRAEEKVDRANIRFLQKQQEIQHPKPAAIPSPAHGKNEPFKRNTGWPKLENPPAERQRPVRRKGRCKMARKRLAPSFAKREHGCLLVWLLC